MRCFNLSKSISFKILIKPNKIVDCCWSNEAFDGGGNGMCRLQCKYHGMVVDDGTLEVTTHVS
jgi:hypothetical protein